MQPELPEEDPFALDRVRRRTAWLTRAGWLVTLPLLALALLRLVAHDACFELIVLNAFTQWLYLPAWGVLLLALRLRRYALFTCAAAIAGAHAVWIGPGALFAQSQPASGAGSAHLRVMSANLLMVNADTDGIVQEILTARPDLLLVQEITPRWAAALDTQELSERLPHRLVIPREDSFGIALYARVSLENREVMQFEGLPALRADLSFAGRRIRVLNVHTLPPRTAAYAGRWNRMMAELVRLVRREARPLLLGGDLNTTPHAAWYRRLLDAGLRGAHESRGRGLATTWPNGRLLVPPIRLDHLLVSPEFNVLAVREGEGRGSDHQPIVVDLAVR